jgi:hypothetical protein
MLDQTNPRVQEFLRGLFDDPIAAHLYFFPHRHTDRSPLFHRQLLNAIYNLNIPRLLAITFRGGAKSTLLEESTLLLSLRGLFKNVIIIGDNETRAAERLQAITHEVETNERIYEVFGHQRGAVWTNTRAVLKSGTYLQAYGRGMALRGAKYHTHRPDLAVLDDIESEDSVNTPESIQKTMRWLTGALIPAMSKPYHIRMAATPLHPNAACVQLSRRDEVNDKPSFFHTIKVPVYSYDNSDPPVLRSAWPERNPLSAMLEEKDKYESMGMAREFAQEYLCEADAESTTAFESTDLPIDTTLKHTYQPTLVIVDPARTAKKTSSLTGVVVCSWDNDKIIVWEAEGYMHRPADIIEKVFELNEKYNPTQILIEKDGLEEFLLQPFRTEQVKRNTFIPLLPVSAPKGKLDFIRALQPYVKAGDIVLAKPCPILQTQLINFPSGKIDTLNALAYALRHHPGESVYTGFSPLTSITLETLSSTPIYSPVLHTLSSSSSETAGAVLMTIRRKVCIIADAVVQGAPITAALTCNDVLKSVAPNRPTSLVIPKKHFSEGDNLGLRAALYHARLRPSMGADPAQSRITLQDLIDHDRLRVDSNATWSLRALTGGYAYDPHKKQPRDNSYRLLMEAIESAVAVLEYQEGEGDKNYRYTADGRRFLSAKG